MFKGLLKQHPFKIALIWALVIFGMCSMPGRFIPTTSWLELLSFDKWVHAGIFFVLSGLLFVAVEVNHQNRNMIFAWCLLSIVYGGLLEIMQAKVFSERSADWQDFIANSFGSLASLSIHKRLVRFVLK